MGNNVSKPARTSPPVRVSYPFINAVQLEKAKADTIRRGQNPDETKCGVVMMFEKNNAEHKEFLRLLKIDAEQALLEHWPDQTQPDGTKIPHPSRPRHPIIGSVIKDGDTGLNKKGILLKEKNPEYAGHWIVRAGCGGGRIPDAILAQRDAKGQPIYVTDQATIYGGCKCRVNMNAYTYSNKSDGVTFGLNGVQKWEDGESFGGGKPALESMFDKTAPPAGPDPFAGAAASTVDPFAGVTTNVDSGPF